ncbi:hypothetical protein MMAD_02680 [Mycolicibacterium madagascariense]|uniref:Lipoprotein n=1 Tax=Mycolicibacterium madagascariense TaxID=212765 RepID=A0A7I7XAL0_9MYCO|nr:hypothetical protein [Mycolicibacterium madagascariense]MCV7015032.1 hypothetical protein [Mycolicibacterium madagascariense]BBZ25973.1 hypothetical protein MMAD_02680 [Mycolicibacterium madagascariense]
MQSWHTRRVAAGLGVAAVVAMGALTACGGSGSGGPSSTTPSTSTTPSSSSTSSVTPSPTEKSLSPNGGGNLFTPQPVAPPSTQTPSPGHHNGS